MPGAGLSGFSVCGYFGAYRCMNEICGALRVGCGGKNGACVVREDLQPGLYIGGGIVFAGFEGNLQVEADESGSEFRHEFFDGVRFAAEPVTAEIAVKARFVTGPVGFMPISA